MDEKENPLLKGTRYLFLKNEKNLTQTQRDKKAELQLSTLNRKLFRALSLRETFQQIYVAQTESDFEILLGLALRNLRPDAESKKTLFHRKIR